MSSGNNGGGCIGEDPALDQFMEAYCEMLTKYEQELSKPFRDAMLFLQRIDSQFKALSISSSHLPPGIIYYYYYYFSLSCYFACSLIYNYFRYYSF